MDINSILFSYGVNPEDESLATCTAEITAVVIKVIEAHVPNLSDENESENALNASNALFGDGDIADAAIRTCACGERVDGFYQYVDHLIAVFGGESHLGG